MGTTAEVKATKVQAAVSALLLLGGAAGAVAAGVTGLVFGAYGCGKLFARWLPFSPFESTVVSLLALMTTVGVAVQLLSLFVASLRRDSRPLACEVCGSDHDHDLADDEPEDADEDDAAELAPNDGLRAALFASGVVKPNAPCPCGGGQRYGKCCGEGRLFRQRRTGARREA